MNEVNQTSTSVFLLLGDNLYNKLKNYETICSKSKNSFIGEVILKVNECRIQNIFLGWSFILKKTQNSIIHNGFQVHDFKGEIFNEIFSKLDKVFYIATGMSISFLVTENGNIYYFSNANFDPKYVDVENKVVSFVKVDTEDLYTVALTKDGKVYDIKIHRDQCAVELNLPLSINEVACGKEHILLLSNTGVVLSYGIGSRGQLGHGNINKLDQPKIIEGLEGLQIKSISAGGWHSAAISCIGDLYMWGWNESGQLGLPCTQCQAENTVEQIYTMCCLPKIIELGDHAVISVSCGSRHTAAIADNNTVWAWGWNNYGQLGNKLRLLSDTPTEVPIPDDFVPKDIVCKFWNTMIIGYFT